MNFCNQCVCAMRLYNYTLFYIFLFVSLRCTGENVHQEKMKIGSTLMLAFRRTAFDSKSECESDLFGFSQLNSRNIVISPRRSQPYTIEPQTATNYYELGLSVNGTPLNNKEIEIPMNNSLILLYFILRHFTFVSPLQSLFIVHTFLYSNTQSNSKNEGITLSTSIFYIIIHYLQWIPSCVRCTLT